MVSFRRLRERLARRQAAPVIPIGTARRRPGRTELLDAPPTRPLPKPPRLPLGLRVRWWATRKVTGLSDKGMWRLIFGACMVFAVVFLAFACVLVMLLKLTTDAIAGPTS